MAPSSAKDRAPLRAMNPPTSQIRRIIPGLGRYPAIKPVVIKIPDPTMAPMTRKVESRRLSFLRRCGLEGVS